MTINIDTIEVVIDIEDKWNVTTNIDSIEAAIHIEASWNMTMEYSSNRGRY